MLLDPVGMLPFYAGFFEWQQLTYAAIAMQVMEESGFHLFDTIVPYQSARLWTGYFEKHLWIVHASSKPSKCYMMLFFQYNQRVPGI